MPWAPDYITEAQLRAYGRVNNDADDVELASAISGASRAVDRECSRQFGKTDAPEAREYTPRWSRTKGAWLVPVDDYHSTVGLSVTADTAGDGSYATAVTGWRAWPPNAVAKGLVYTALLVPQPTGFRLCGAALELRATNVWGWPAIPEAVVLGVKMQASRFDARRDSPFGVAGSPDNGGSELRLLAKLDPDVAVDLNYYRRRVKVR